MGSTHSHDDHDHAEHAGDAEGEHRHDHSHGASEQRLRAALAVLFLFTLIEAAGGLWANSIALLAESAHMLADSASLLLAILAVRFARRPASPERTYGNQRYQTLAAYTNGVALVVLTAWVAVEALRRVIAPPEVNGQLMLVVAIIGGVANLAAFLILSGASSLNERGARAHVLSDLLGSGAAVGAAVIILLFGWHAADPLLSIAVGILIFRSGWQLTHETAHVLLEGTPPSLKIEKLGKHLTQLPGVVGVHHVHVWSLTGDQPMVTLHAQLQKGADRSKALGSILEQLRERFGVKHATVQIEEDGCLVPDSSDSCHKLD